MALLMASVSSVLPSPVAPKFFTSKSAATRRKVADRANRKTKFWKGWRGGGQVEQGIKLFSSRFFTACWESMPAGPAAEYPPNGVFSFRPKTIFYFPVPAMLLRFLIFAAIALAGCAMKDRKS